MKCNYTKPAIVLMVIFIVCGCASFQKTVPVTNAAAASVTTSDRQRHDFESESSYYYFIESQIQKKSGDLDKAVDYLIKAIEYDPGSSYLKKELAVLYLHQKKNTMALEVIEEVLKKDPEYVPALIIYGRIKQSLGQIEETKKAFEKIISVDPKEENIYLLLGSIYMDEEDINNALRIYEQLVHYFPGSYAGHFFIGKIFTATEKYGEAEKEFLKTLEMQPDLEEPRLELLKLYKNQGKSEKILQLCNDILEKNPDNIAAVMELGYYYHQNNRQPEAEKIFEELGAKSISDRNILRKVVQLYLDQNDYDFAVIVLQGMLKGAPESSDLHYVTGVAFNNKKDYDAAVDHFKKVKPESRFYKESVIHIAFVYQERGNVQAAVDMLKEAMDRLPGDSELYLYLGSFYEDTNEFEKAEAALKQGIEIDPSNTKLFFRLGVVYDKWGRKSDSIENMKAVIKLDPQNANALNYLGYTYAEMGQNLDEAEDLIKEALKHKPGDGFITDSLGWVYFKKGLFNQAVELLEKAVSIEPDDPTILEHLGDAYLKVNQKKKALEVYKRSLLKKEKDRVDLEKKIQALNGDKL